MTETKQITQKSLYDSAREEYRQNGYSARFEELLDALAREGWMEYTFAFRDTERVAKRIAEVGTHRAMVGILSRVCSDVFSNEKSRELAKMLSDKILKSRDVEANLLCFKLNKNLFAENLEVLNNPSAPETYKKYIDAKIGVISTNSEAEELDLIIGRVGDVALARKFLSKLNTFPMSKEQKAIIWERQATTFVEANEPNESIWFLLKRPDYVPMDAYFDKLEQQVLLSGNGDYNLMFLAKYPYMNFREHEKAILNSNSGIAIRQFAGLFGGREESAVKAEERANLQGCADAIAKADSERSIYAFAIHYDQYSDIDLSDVFARLAKSETKKYQEYGAQMGRENEITRLMQ